MTTVTYTTAADDRFNDLFLLLMDSAPVGAHSATSFNVAVVDDPNQVFHFTGVGFANYGNGSTFPVLPQAGTLTGLTPIRNRGDLLK